MRLSDDEVLVVAMIPDDREPFRAARQIVAKIAGTVPGPPLMVLPIRIFGPGACR